MEHKRYAYDPIIDRKPLRWPNGARVAVWVCPNIEHYLYDRPGAALAQVTTQFDPDVFNHSWRDFGNRVGVWRMMEIMEKYGARGTVCLNSEVCQHYPRIIEEGRKLNWEWMGHGTNNNTFINKQTEEEERALIALVRDTITEGTGVKPRGWLGPGLTESHRTPDLLAEAGFDYVGDWTNDEQPYRMNVRKGTLFTIPYSVELNDIGTFLGLHHTPETFYRMICDQFDVLYEDGAKTARVMAICLHPFLIGHPFRAKYLDLALKYIKGHKDAWFATGSEIIDAYKKAVPA